jgi:hypothetical protein
MDRSFTGRVRTRGGSRKGKEKGAARWKNRERTTWSKRSLEAFIATECRIGFASVDKGSNSGRLLDCGEVAVARDL